MNNSLPEADPIAQAAYWQAQLSSDLVTKQQQREFEQWLEQSLDNRRAWEETNAFWRGLDTLDEADFADLIAPASGQTSATSSIPQRKTKRWHSKPILAAAASVLVTVALLYSQVELWLADYRTATGVVRTVQLDDGSAIMLNSASAVTVDYSLARRRIILNRGEIYCQVAADGDRPFVVETTAGSVRALGTAFDVADRSGEITVTVTEHAVRITAENGQALESLPEGRQAAFSKHGVNTPSSVDWHRTLAWREHKMMFEDQPLADVVAELERYHHGAIIIFGDRLKTIPVTGVFDTDDIDLALDTIQQSLPIELTRITGKLTIIH